MIDDQESDGSGLEPHEAEWLSLIGYQLRSAKVQSQQPAPMNSLAIAGLQDAIESLLSLAAESLKASVKNRSDFAQLFDAVDTALPADVSIAGHRSAMMALNQARVGFKHHGNRVDEKTLTRHLVNAENLANELSTATFGVRIDEVSLLLFVRVAKVREHLESAALNWDRGEWREAMQDLWVAFDALVTDYQERKSWYPGKSLFSTKPSFMPTVFDLKDAGKVAEKAFEWLKNLDSWVGILAIGVDARGYAFFNAHTPTGMKVLSGDTVFTWSGDDAAPTDEIFLRCQAFVIETALELADGDFSFDAWAARQAAKAVEDPTE